MKARAGSGWQYVMTDLSLILFMITAAALRDAPPSGVEQPAPITVPAEGDPVAVWRGGANAPDLRAWLVSSGADQRLRLTIYAAPDAAAAALALARDAGRPGRIVLDPALGGAPYAALTFDRGMARPLQPAVPTQPDPENMP